MNRHTYYVKVAVLVGAVFFCRAALAMLGQAEGHDKYITQLEIDGGSLTQIDQIFILPYTAGPMRSVQEAPGITLNGIQDYAVTEQMAGRWKAGQLLVYNLEKPMLLNITTHNAELLVGIKMVGKMGPAPVDTWPFDVDNVAGESNVLRINLSAPYDNRVAIVTSKKK